MKVRIFGGTLTEVETKLNVWLREQPSVNVEFVTQSTGAYLIVTVFYTEKR